VHSEDDTAKALPKRTADAALSVQHHTVLYNMPTKMKTEKQYRWWTVGIAYSEVPNGEGRDAGIGEGRACRGGGTICEPAAKTPRMASPNWVRGKTRRCDVINNSQESQNPYSGTRRGLGLGRGHGWAAAREGGRAAHQHGSEGPRLFLSHKEREGGGSHATYGENKTTSEELRGGFRAIPTIPCRREARATGSEGL